MDESGGQEKEEIKEEEEYVLLDLDSVSAHIHIPPNAPYVLSIGEYEETIGTCLVFNESEAAPDARVEIGPSETNVFSGKRTMDPKQIPAKQVNPIATLHKVLKFKLVLEADGEYGTDKEANTPSDGLTSNAIT